MAHVREPGAELLQIGAAKGADTEEFDVVGNQHDVPGREGGVHRAGSVGDYQRFRPQQPQHPDRIADILKGPALIGVGGGPASPPRPDPPGGRTRTGPRGPGRWIASCGGTSLIGDGNGGLHFVAQRAQAGAQDQQAPGAERPPGGLSAPGRSPDIVRMYIPSYASSLQLFGRIPGRIRRRSGRPPRRRGTPRRPAAERSPAPAGRSAGGARRSPEALPAVPRTP